MHHLVGMVQVTRICKRTIVSTKPVQRGKVHTFSVLDRTMEHSHLKAVYYYRTQPGKYKAGELTSMLRESLSATLTWYPVVTGRLIRDENGHWMVKCNDAGVRTVEATATGSVDEWLSNLDRVKEIENFVHWEDMFYKPYYWSTFYVQITEFEVGGVAIGLSCTHLLADPTASAMFIKAWADTTLSGKMSSPPFFHPLPPRRPGNKKIDHKPNAHLVNHYKASRNLSPLTTSGEDITTVSLLFTDEKVRELMVRGSAGEEGASVSPFDALCGLFWVCISRARGLKDELMNMSVCVDVRKVLGLDKGYLGNCMVYSKVEAQSEKGVGFLQAVNGISKLVSEMDNEGVMDLVEWLEQNDGQYHPSLDGTNLICANLEGMEDLKGTVFKHEMCGPIVVSYYLEPFFGEGHVLVMPSTRMEDGPLSRIVMVTLPKDMVIRVCEDDQVMSLCPTILMKSQTF